MKRILLILTVLCLLFLCGCSLFAPAVYSVEFIANGQVINRQQVEQDSCPAPFSFGTGLQGLYLLGWTHNGETVDPFTTPIPQTEDVFTFEAVLAPAYTNYMPYLFTDEKGNLNPEMPLTQEAVQQALEALAPEQAKPYIPAIVCEDPQQVTGDEVAAILAGSFENTALEEVFSNTPLTRAAFAQAMHSLLKWDTEAPFVLGAASQIPADITQDRADAAILLSASMRHTPDADGITWAENELPVSDPEGFLLKEGKLYYVNEDRYLLKNGDVGLLHFGADGSYTSTDAELDEMVTNQLARLMQENPEADRFALLRKAYDLCHTQYKYLRRDAYATGETGWEIEDAKTMFSTGRGNCYNFAAIFWALARGLGYDARAVSGTCTGTDQPHGWVIIELDGADYFFDPEWQYAYTERGEFDHDMFMIPMDKVSYWTYRWQE